MRKFTYLSIISHQFLINFSLSNKHSSGGRRNKGKERKKEKKEEKKRERERDRFRYVSSTIDRIETTEE
jgi:hypothetical protein